MSKEFIQLINSIGMKIKIISIEVYNSIGIIEYYYSLIRYTYNIIIAEIPDINKEIVL